MAPSNEPTDVGMAKIFKACQKHDILKGEYIIRRYNVKTESNYVHAYARLQTKSANDAATLLASSAKPEPATLTIAVEPTTPIAPAVVPFVA
ncbi:hypothetical protein V496_02407 [Pseudogymnoascus sp. VKM F-4515 (FW-2607)]|nr:hypothetical protein V496_02407 [Pseudogymnoascus sp. VKM F-4515 (FW-2607)]